MATHSAPRMDEILSPAAKETLKHLELHARTAVEGMLQGLHRSKRKGVSTEFDHHKLYQAGDPLKHIDWKVSARHDRYYLKRYLEDTSMAVRLVVDRSASMAWDSGGASKYLAAARAAAALAYLVVRQRDSVGLALASSDGAAWLPPSSADSQVVRILRELARREAAAPDGLTACLKTILESGGRRGLLVLVSDLLFPPESVQRELGRLAARGHEILILQVRDPMEEDFPFTRWVRFGDLEDPSVRHLIDAVLLKKLYREEFQALRDEWQAWARKLGAHLASFRTDEKVETVLSQYLAFRAGRAGV